MIARAGQTLGLEMEMAVARRDTGASHAVSGYFARLAAIKAMRDESPGLSQLAGRDVGVSVAAGESGLDNGFNLLETAFAPVSEREGGLAELGRRVRRELDDAQAALEAEGATVLNVSEHPACTLDPAWYASVQVPRPIYRELVGHREWLHRVGIDAKAQNSPCTSVDVRQAARALNVVLALAPASVAIFANSPLENGRETGFKENRLTVWDRMFRHSRYAGDHYLQRLPERPFADLGDYFRWMFGPETASRCLPLAFEDGYKSAVGVYLQGSPSLSRFIASEGWPGLRTDTGASVTVAPHGGHFEYSQFAHFLDARWRYRLASPPPLPALREAWRRPGGIEELYAGLGVVGYIEGRAPGACFADEQLVREAGQAVAATTVMAPSALQLGLMRNLDAAEDLMREWGWLRLRGLRAVAMRDALDDDAVCALARDTLAVAQASLDAGERRWLDYARYVVDSRSTGADRLLRLWRGHAADTRRLAAVCRARAVLPL
ncbi:glutamate-cysteine ligase family protein [Achromobacter sp. NFACC18-2]|uniref:glutamate-cysteine ligase family protein n=1 Tax=Achromobacter sp. NFACC18-2 TaxID=1564112 RepID=UPI0008B78662|nr:glutamate-cysteine ligase family protein [Achromobacter sp. NFACC18-2]SEJ51557.1 Glutamate-cysteine ligase family 2(GCS2) [Achromobacter sp. NFACC18-2]